MNPTLRTGDKLFGSAYHDNEVQKGDVVVFLNPDNHKLVVHRVVSVTSGIQTRGDNNSETDPWLLQIDQIVGRIHKAVRNKKSITIFGGRIGAVHAKFLKAKKRLNYMTRKMLQRPYRHLSKIHLIKACLTPVFHPQILCITRTEGKELQLIFRKKVIGRCCPGSPGWRIYPPYKMIIDEKRLPAPTT